MHHSENLNRLKMLFRELFQLDTADLDFGLYRLFRLKRAEIEAFLGEQLPAEVDRAFASVTESERASIQSQMEALARQARELVADDAILATGQPNPKYAETKAVKEYAAACRRLEAAEASDAQRAEVFNQLYAFFSRYYDQGDFIPRRFFGAQASYAVPYNGEEVLFHWANKDQYYVKSGEAFRDYAFTVPTLHGEYRVRFKLVEATAPRDNTKGDVRHFFPRPKDTIFDEGTKTLAFAFEYRLPTETEAVRYGKNSKAQAAILDEATPKLLNAVKDDVLGAALAALAPAEGQAERDPAPSLLRRRLTHFTRKRTSDYFVHKNLGGFLRQELEFFIRDQIVCAADLEADFEGRRQMLRVFRKLADTVITFLAQIEDTQKRLFEKKKFVLRTDYLVPIQNVPRKLWPEVLSNEAQLQEWKELYNFSPESDIFNITGEINEYVLEQHPTIVVDTRHFALEFRYALLAGIKNIEDQIDGLLIHGANFHALRLMEQRYREQVKCIYIDPPYNTGSDGFIYKDRFRHASWLSMIQQTLFSADVILSGNGAVFVSADDNEVDRLKSLLGHVFGEQHFIASIIWQKMFSPKSTARHFSENHDYIVAFAKSRNGWQPTLLPRTEKADARYENIDNDKRGVWTSGDLTARNYYSEGQYEVTSPSGKKFHPSIGRYWLVKQSKFIELDRDKRIWWGLDGNNMPRLKRFLHEVRKGIVPQTIWSYKEVGHTQEAKQELLSIINYERTEDVLNTVKPTRLIGRILHLGTNSQQDEIVLDFFAGSGSTGHAVIRKNREDGGKRRFVLVEIERYFDDVVLKRIKKVIFTPEWKAGKPKRAANPEEAERTPTLVKVLRLESYEDTLHNTFSENVADRIADRDHALKKVVGDHEYRIRYMVRSPLDASDSMLNLGRLAHPFDYTLEVLTDYGPETRNVDLMETFNWLYGLRVRRFHVWTNPEDQTPRDEDGRVYRAVFGTDRDGKKRVLVVWRDMTGIDPATDRAFLEARAAEIGPFEEQWINGDAAAKGFASLDALFKRLMTGSEA